jgi:arginyl-tRNA synthetase
MNKEHLVHNRLLHPQSFSQSCLVSSFKLTLEKALDLLGITAPQRM